MSIGRLLSKSSFLRTNQSPVTCTGQRLAAFSSNQSSTHDSVPSHLNPRWLSDLKARIGRCVTFGLKPQQNREAGEILNQMARDWRELVAGSEWFLTGKWRKGLYRHGVVWGEMDAMGHVNNVTYVRYAESARINWAQNFANHLDPAHKIEWSELWTPQGEGLILRSIKTDYKFPMTWPDHVTVYHKLRSLPSSYTDSFVLDVLILSERHQRPAARCVEDIVVYDYRRGEKTPLKPFMVEEFRKTFAMQQEKKTEYGNRVRDLIGHVERLEKASWDQEDAREDLGGSFKTRQ